MVLKCRIHVKLPCGLQMFHLTRQVEGWWGRASYLSTVKIHHDLEVS